MPWPEVPLIWTLNTKAPKKPQHITEDKNGDILVGLYYLQMMQHFEKPSQERNVLSLF